MADDRPAVEPWDDATMERVRLMQERLWNLPAWAGENPTFGTVERARQIAAFGQSRSK